MSVARTAGCFALSLVAICLVPCLAGAQEPDYPNRNITVLLGYGAGGGADTSTRFFADKLSKLAGKPVIVENRPGAQAAIAADAAARARPDGYTVLFAAGNALASTPYTLKKVNFDPLKSFDFVTTLWQTPYVLVASPKRDVKTVADLTAYLRGRKDKPGLFGYQGSINQAAGELYKIMARVDATPVPYKTAQQILADLMSGDIDFAFLDSTFALEQTRAGNLRGLAVTLPAGSPIAPELPGMKDAGLPDFDISAWFAVYLPANSAPSTTAALSKWLNQIIAAQDTQEFLLRTGTQPFPGSPESLARYQREQVERWAALIKAAGIEAQ